jgi:hypothetical protein
MRSTIGGVIGIDQVGVLFCLSNLEPSLSLSTAEAEYKSIFDVSRKLVSLRQFLEEQGFHNPAPTKVFNDNQAAIAMTKQDFSSSKNRHIKLRFHYIRECVKEGIVEVTYLPTEEMVADVMTKPLDSIKFKRFRDILMSGLFILPSVPKLEQGGV